MSLVGQGIGGGIASNLSTRSGTDLGRNIMLAGIVFQLGLPLLPTTKRV